MIRQGLCVVTCIRYTFIINRPRLQTKKKILFFFSENISSTFKNGRRAPCPSNMAHIS